MQVSANVHNLYQYQQILAPRGPDAGVTHQEKWSASNNEAAKDARSQALFSRSLTSSEVNHTLLFTQGALPADASGGDAASIKAELDRYYANERPASKGGLELRTLPPLHLPTADNIDALSQHASARFKDMLDEYGIPAAPDKITYDREGKLRLPADYPHTDELMKALEENPGLERELRSLNALSSHYVAMQERAPFVEEAKNATSQTEVEQIFARYRQLLADENRYTNIALTFSPTGELSVTANGDPVLRS